MYIMSLNFVVLFRKSVDSISCPAMQVQTSTCKVCAVVNYKSTLFNCLIGNYHNCSWFRIF